MIPGPGPARVAEGLRHAPQQRIFEGGRSLIRWQMRLRLQQSLLNANLCAQTTSTQAGVADVLVTIEFCEIDLSASFV